MFSLSASLLFDDCSDFSCLVVEAGVFDSKRLGYGAYGDGVIYSFQLWMEKGEVLLLPDKLEVEGDAVAPVL